MKVILYYDEKCFDCVVAKIFFEAIDVDLELKNLKEERNKLELIEKTHKYIAPVIIIDGDIYIGFGSIEGKFISNAHEICDRLGLAPAVRDEEGKVINVLPKIIKTLDIV
jgi:glutaredoxin